MDEQKPGQVVGSRSDEQAPQKSSPEPAKQATKAEAASGWQFKADDQNTLPPSADNAAKSRPNTQGVSWSASEFISHQKTASWYMLLGVGGVIFAILIYLFTRDKISTAVVLFAVIILGVFAARKPRTLDYRLDEGGLRIANKFYGYELFKSFSIIDEGAFSSILLMPLKRFMPTLTVYYDPKDEDMIIDMLADRLPMEQSRADTVDQLLRKIRF